MILIVKYKKSLLFPKKTLIFEKSKQGERKAMYSVTQLDMVNALQSNLLKR